MNLRDRPLHVWSVTLPLRERRALATMVKALVQLGLAAATWLIATLVADSPIVFAGMFVAMALVILALNLISPDENGRKARLEVHADRIVFRRRELPRRDLQIEFGRWTTGSRRELPTKEGKPGFTPGTAMGVVAHLRIQGQTLRIGGLDHALPEGRTEAVAPVVGLQSVDGHLDEEPFRELVDALCGKAPIESDYRTAAASRAATPVLTPVRWSAAGDSFGATFDINGSRLVIEPTSVTLVNASTGAVITQAERAKMAFERHNTLPHNKPTTFPVRDPAGDDDEVRFPILEIRFPSGHAIIVGVRDRSCAWGKTLSYGMMPSSVVSVSDWRRLLAELALDPLP